MASFNKIAVVGYLGRDPEMRYLPDSTPVCSFSVATTEKKKDMTGTLKENTIWFRIVIFGRSAEACNEYLGKGSQVYVSGRLSMNEYTSRDGENKLSLEIRADDVQFLNTKSKSEVSPSHSSEIDESEIPF